MQSNNSLVLDHGWRINHTVHSFIIHVLFRSVPTLRFSSSLSQELVDRGLAVHLPWVEHTAGEVTLQTGNIHINRATENTSL